VVEKVVESGVEGHPFAGFTLHAAIDRVVFEVRFVCPSQFAHVQNRMVSAGLGRQFVHEVDPYTFRTTIQNPKGPDSFLAAAQALAPPTQSDPITANDITIIEVETALDARPIGAFDDAVLAGAVLHLVHHHANPPESFRVVREKALGNNRPQSMGLAVALRRGDSTLCAGQYVDGVEFGAWNNDTNVFMLRAYSKTYDTLPGNTKRQPLPKDKQAARLEVVLNGASVPFSTLAEWRVFRFETLTRYFRQVQTDTNSPILKMWLDWVVSIGERIDHARRAQHRRNSRLGTARDTYLNKRIHRALLGLTDSQKMREFAHPKRYQNDRSHWGNAQSKGHVLNTNTVAINTVAPTTETTETTDNSNSNKIKQLTAKANCIDATGPQGALRAPTRPRAPARRPYPLNHERLNPVGLTPGFFGFSMTNLIRSHLQTESARNQTVRASQMPPIRIAHHDKSFMPSKTLKFSRRHFLLYLRTPVQV
jgi:hypothetical protein